jgi:hypothetical protein
MRLLNPEAIPGWLYWRALGVPRGSCVAPCTCGDVTQGTQSPVESVRWSEFPSRKELNEELIRAGLPPGLVPQNQWERLDGRVGPALLARLLNDHP